MLTAAGSLILVLLALAVAGLALGRRPQSRILVYGGCFGIATALTALGLAALAFGREPATLVLPLGVPWLGMHLRLDPLSAFFMLVVDLGAALACLYALGYTQGETAPRRVLPFVPAFLAGMNLVLLADDAFTFLLAWEFMSLTSWALVLRDHESGRHRARPPTSTWSWPASARRRCCSASACSPGRAAPTTSPASATARPS